MKYVILIPIFNDWDCLNQLIPKIDQTLSDTKEEVSILIVNDGSTKKKDLSINKIIYLKKVEILNLKNNVKAQIAIATGLGYLRREKFDGGIIVMDGDGQDDPNQLIDLIEKSINEPKIAITVNRSKREEDFTFKILYQLYLVLTFLLTFKYLKFGVFSYLHYSSIDRILSTEDVYMAYVAGFAKHFKNKNTIYAARKKRITGKSQNNYRSLIYYALKIISVFRYQALINATVISFAGYLLTGFTIYSLIFVFALFAFIIIIFLIPHRVDKFFIKNSLSNIKNIENLNN